MELVGSGSEGRTMDLYDFVPGRQLSKAEILPIARSTVPGAVLGILYLHSVNVPPASLIFLLCVHIAFFFSFSFFSRPLHPSYKLFFQIVHVDIKAENVVISVRVNDGKVLGVKVVDFGFAAFLKYCAAGDCFRFSTDANTPPEV